MLNEKSIAIPIAAPTLDEALRRVAEAEPLADVIEFRLDYLTVFSIADPLPCVTQLVGATALPVIMTYHPEFQQQAGHIPTFQDQITFWRTLFSLAGNDRVYFDLDLRLVEWFQSAGESAPWGNIIASYHNFKETPETLPELYQRMKTTPAGILKIATHAQAISDNVKIFRVLERARQDNRRLIGLTMGDAGLMSRILSPAWGGILTFGALTRDEQTAPGQITADELVHLFRARDLHQDVNVAGVIGNAIQHSLSPLLHNPAFQELSLDWVYLPLMVTDLSSFIRDFVNPSMRRMDWNVRGLSVTIPHKVEAMKFVAVLDPVAEQVGALNTLVMDGDNIIGYNTDVEGAMRPLRQRIEVRGARVVMLGAGGAARAVGFGLQREGARITVLARDVAKATDVAGRLNAQAGSINDLSQYDYDILINATPVGMGRETAVTPVPTHLLKPGTVVFDLVASRRETQLLHDARAAGCVAINGLEMLVHQAARQFELWTGRTAPVETMFKSVGFSSRL